MSRTRDTQPTRVRSLARSDRLVLPADSSTMIVVDRKAVTRHSSRRRTVMNQDHRLTSGLAMLFVVPTLLAATTPPGEHSRRAADAKAKVVAGTWKLTVPENGDPWRIGFGSGTDFPQFAALDTRSGYFRLVSGTTWGTSIVLPPPFWSGGKLLQGVPIKASHLVDGDKLIINASGVRDGLKLNLRVSLSPPSDGRIVAEVSGRSEGKIELDCAARRSVQGRHALVDARRPHQVGRQVGHHR